MPAATARALHALRRSRTPGLMLSFAIWAGACGGKEPPLPQKGPPAYGIPRQRPTSTATTPPGKSPEPIRSDQNRALPTDQRPRSEEPPPTAAEEAPPEEKKERNYSAELAGLLSKSVPGCLASFAPSTSVVSIQVTAQVMTSGTVSRAEAQGAGLTPPALACIKKAAGALQLNGPVADAPRSVQAQLTLQTQATPKPAQPLAAEEDTREDERDGDPRDSKVHQVDDNPREVEQKVDEQTREGPEPADPKDEPPTDNHTD